MHPMRKRIGGLIVIGLTLLSITALADSHVEIDGQVRYRGFLDARDFDSDTDAWQYGELRTRIGLTARPQDNLMLFVELQDSRVLGENSGGLTPDAEVDLGVELHQGYLVYDLDDSFSFQAGRQEIVYGNHRLLGNVGWSNVGRRWDGARARWEGESTRIDLFGAKLNETYATGTDDDHDMGGLYVTFKDKGFDLFFLADVNKNPIGAAEREDTRGTLGAYSSREFGGNFDYIFNGAYQTGKLKNDSGAVFKFLNETDLSAYLMTLEVGYNFLDERKTRLALGIDYASGDDPESEEYGAFDNLYYTGHKFRGYMDYFIGSNTLGLVDLMLRFQTGLSERWTVKADVHSFSTAQDFVLTDGGTSKSLGNEVDLTLVYQDRKFAWTGGLSVFSDSDDAGDSDILFSGDPFGGEDGAWWAYSMFTANF